MTTIDKIMRRDVVALALEESLPAAWRRLRSQGLGSLPVVDAAGRLADVLTEQDLLARLAPCRVVRWWEAAFGSRDRLAAGFIKSVGTTAGDVMTIPPVVIEPDASVDAAARLMQSRGTDALVVVADGVCLGVVTRRDVLEHLATSRPPARGVVGDEDLAQAMRDGIAAEPWTATHQVTVDAAGGRLRLTGVVTSTVERSALVAMAHALPGCAGVEDHLLVLGPGRRPLV
jgi:CBS domain-containing protein